jgi:hypothetical protein
VTDIGLGDLPTQPSLLPSLAFLVRQQQDQQR